MSKEHDRQFFDTFMIVLGVLVAFTIVIYFLANAIHARTQMQYIAEDRLRATMVTERIEPFGEVAIAGQTPPPARPAVAAPAVAGAPLAEPPPGTASAPAPATGAATTAAIDGKTVYDGGCIACHAAGVGGAPKTGDVEAWRARIAKGIDTLYSNSINGFDGEAVMPMLPKGGLMHLSDAEVKAAVDYMVAASQ